VGANFGEVGRPSSLSLLTLLAPLSGRRLKRAVSKTVDDEAVVPDDVAGDPVEALPQVG